MKFLILFILAMVICSIGFKSSKIQMVGRVIPPTIFLIIKYECFSILPFTISVLNTSLHIPVFA